MKEKARKTRQKRTWRPRSKRGDEIDRESGIGRGSWTVGFDRVSMFGSEEEEEEGKLSRFRVSSHKATALISSVDNDDSQLDRFFFRKLIFDEHSWLGVSVNRLSLAEC